MMLSVIIPTYNGKHKLPRIIQALENQDQQDFQTVIVVDGSTDGTIEYLQALSHCLSELIIVNRPNGGRSKSRNHGAKVATAELLLFLDDDMRPDHQVISQHILHHTTHHESILVGNQIEDLSLCETDIQKYKAHLSRTWMEQLKIESKATNVPFITAAHFSVSKQLFLDLGGFDELLNDTEDFDLAVKAVKAGVRIHVETNLIAWHDDFLTCKKYIMRLREYEKSALKLYKLRSDDMYKPNSFKISPVKRLFFRFFALKLWVRLIDLNKLSWLPMKIRYKMYAMVITAMGSVFTKKSL